jgi:hypothetical protein
MIGEFLVFKIPVNLKLAVSQNYPQKISFVDTDKKDFKTYTGSWTINSLGQTSHIDYQLNFKTNLPVPPFLEQDHVRYRILELLKEVKREIEKRR